MTDKRFTYVGDFRLKDNETGNYISISNDISDEDVIVAYNELMCSLLNEQHKTIQRLKENIIELLSVDIEEKLLKDNEQLRTKNNAYIQDIEVFKEEDTHLKLENELLKQDNNALIHLLENQSMIIEELHSKLLEYQVKEPIVLTKEDLELMGKAVSYYTHGRCVE